MKPISLEPMMPVESLGFAKDLQAQQGVEGSSFGKMLEGALNEVQQRHGEAEKAIQDLTLGRNKDIHNTMIALEKAEVSFQLMMQVRNKVIEAYQEVARMQV
jgi:flagellar hook-basal body complex protein FliE